jgi:hypothetical protein
MTIDSVKSSNISQDISQSSNTPKDISKSSFLDQGWAIGLRALAPTRWGENLKNVLGEFFHSPLRLSYNPDTLLNKFLSGITAPVRALSQALGWSKPTPSPPKEMYSGAYQSIKADSNNSTIEIPGYNDFKELNRSVQISGLNSNSNGKPEPEELLALGLQPLFNPKEGAVGLKSMLGEEDEKEMQRLFGSLPPNLQDALKVNGSIQDSNTGLVTSVMYSSDDKKLHVIFGGTGAGTDAVKNKSFAMETEQYLGDVTTVGLLTSHVPPSYHQAQKLVGALKEVAQKNGLTLEVDGFSKGGGEAAYAGIYHEVKTLSHCGTALSPACQRSLGQEKIKKAVQNDLIFNTSVQGCFMTDQKTINNVFRAWEQLTGLQVARHIGPGIRVNGHGKDDAHVASFSIFKEKAELETQQLDQKELEKLQEQEKNKPDIDEYKIDVKCVTEDRFFKNTGIECQSKKIVDIDGKKMSLSTPNSNVIERPEELKGGKLWTVDHKNGKKEVLLDFSSLEQPFNNTAKDKLEKIKTGLEENLKQNNNENEIWAVRIDWPKQEPENKISMAKIDDDTEPDSSNFKNEKDIDDDPELNLYEIDSLDGDDDDEFKG